MNSDHNRIEAAAAKWFALKNAGFSAEQARAFREWLDANDQHRRIYDEIERTWTLLHGLKEALPDGAEETAPDPDFFARKSFPRHRTWLMTLSMAAALVVMGVFFWNGAFRPPNEAYVDEVITAANGFQRIVLPDGSVIKLNADSHLRVDYNRNERRTRLLRGEAHFIVAKNPRRPFFVEARSAAVRAVGTAFNVRLDKDSIEVVVTEGKVQVNDSPRAHAMAQTDPRPEAPLLVPGDKAVIQDETVASAAVPPLHEAITITNLAPEALQQTLAWHEQRLEFIAAPLSEIIAAFNRYNRSQIRIDDSGLATQRFGGSFRADEPEEFIRLLQARFGLTVESKEGETLLRREPPDSAGGFRVAR